MRLKYAGGSHPTQQMIRQVLSNRDIMASLDEDGANPGERLELLFLLHQLESDLLPRLHKQGVWEDKPA